MLGANLETQSKLICHTYQAVLNSVPFEDLNFTGIAIQYR